MRWILCSVSTFIGLLLLAAPNLTRRELLFAVPVPAGFRESRAARRAIFRFRAATAAATVVGLAIIALGPAEHMGMLAIAVQCAMFLTAAISFYRQNRKLAFAAVQHTRPIDVDLSPEAERLPRFLWLAAGPFALLAASAVWLYLNPDRIPARFPVHFDVTGRPDRWTEATIRGVYGPLLAGTALVTWMLVAALVGWYGSRRTAARPVLLGSMIAIQYLLAFVFALVALQAPLGIPIWMIAVLPMIILIPLLVAVGKRLKALPGPLDVTPNDCWKGGIFYYNPNDAAVVVEKREGFGYTFNFGNGWSWVLVASLVFVIAFMQLVLP